MMEQSRSLQTCMRGTAYVKLADEHAWNPMGQCEKVPDEG